MKSRTGLLRWRLICVLLIGLGFATSTGLLLRTFSLIEGGTPGAPNICSAMFGTSCDETLLDPMSWLFGIPLAGWGLVYYATLGWLLVLMSWLQKAFEVEAAIAALLFALSGALVSILLSVAMFAGQTAICPLCLVVHGINFALVPIFKVLSQRSWPGILAEIQSAARYLAHGTTANSDEARWKLVGFASAALVALIAYQWVFVEMQIRTIAAASLPSDEELIAAYAGSTVRELPIDETDPQIGDPAAPVQLVVFSSFQCPACASFAKTISQLTAQFPDDLSIVFKHFPLSSACNPQVTVEAQRNTCELAVAGVAAHQQRRFWSFHDAVFASGLGGDEGSIVQAAQKAGLSIEQFDMDRRAPSSLARVAQDAELGGRLGVQGTPTVFLNGRHVRQLSSEALAVVIKYVLSQPAQ